MVLVCGCGAGNKPCALSLPNCINSFIIASYRMTVELLNCTSICFFVLYICYVVLRLISVYIHKIRYTFIMYDASLSVIYTSAKILV